MSALLARMLLFQQLISSALWSRLVLRVMRDHPEFSRERAEICIDSALGFLSLCARYPGKKFVPSPMTDIGWHTFLLYTREYAEFCERVAGRFINHSPHDDGKTHEGKPIETVRFMEAEGIGFHPEAWVVNQSSSDCGEGDCHSCDCD